MERERNGEFDLVNFIGVIIRHRKTITYLIIALFIIFSCGMFLFDRYKQRQHMPKGHNPKFVLKIDNEPLLFLFNFSKKYYQAKMNVAEGTAVDITYESFVSGYVFATAFRIPAFSVEIQEGKSLEVAYVFNSKEDMEYFTGNYNKVITEAKNYYSSKKLLSDVDYVRCIHAFASVNYTSTEKVLEYFINKSGECEKTYYGYDVIRNRMILGLGKNITEVSAPTISMMLESTEPFFTSNKPSQKDVSTTGLAKLSEKKNEGMTKIKIVKTILLSIALSFVLSIFAAFILEFIFVNKTRLKKYV
jgi:hypothetical protein